ncbi:type II secretion system protein GspM [Thiomicrorhabdus aquaedulcis]|uniref:type II secretion system protein GspM n=1 Tax=Thiomicrorhabdus aquaedulcis TaxID=2211106 RepID=UPI000FD6BB6A|nr:type II secretion system protein GspM [Thiomicrorhabdus aquaedulcis]
MWMQINQAWSALAVRERRLLIGLAVFLTGFMFYQLLWLPIQNAQQQAHAALQKSQADWQWLNEQAPKIVEKSATGRATVLTDPLAFNSKTALIDSVQQTLRVQNLLRAAQGIEPTAQGVKVRFAQVDAPRLFAWLAALEQQGLVASRLDITPISPGLTQAEVQFDVLADALRNAGTNAPGAR